jgi:hypothetical protein
MLGKELIVGIGVVVNDIVIVVAVCLPDRVQRL